MLSDSKCKQILNQNGFYYTDEEITLIKETLYKLVEIIHKDDIKRKSNSKSESTKRNIKENL